MVLFCWAFCTSGMHIVKKHYSYRNQKKNLASPHVAKRRRCLMNSLGLHSIQTDPSPPNLAFMPTRVFFEAFGQAQQNQLHCLFDLFYSFLPSSPDNVYFWVLGSTFTSKFSPLVSRPLSRLRHAHKPGGTPTRMLVVQCRLQGSGPTIGLFHEHLRSTVIQVLLT